MISLSQKEAESIGLLKKPLTFFELSDEITSADSGIVALGGIIRVSIQEFCDLVRMGDEKKMEFISLKLTAFGNGLSLSSSNVIGRFRQDGASEIFIEIFGKLSESMTSIIQESIDWREKRDEESLELKFRFPA